MNWAQTATVVGMLITALGGGAFITAMFKIGPERRKMTADAFRAGVDSATHLSKSTLEVVTPALEQVTFLRAELATTRDENQQMRVENQQLRAEMAQLMQRLSIVEAMCRNAGLAIPQ